LQNVRSLAEKFKGFYDLKSDSITVFPGLFFTGSLLILIEISEAVLMDGNRTDSGTRGARETGMPQWIIYLILFGVGILAGIINVNAGGGSSITLPALIFLGLEGAVANGTNRIGILIQNIFAVASFRKRQFHEFPSSLTLACFTLPGAVAGALLSVRLDDEWFRRILAVIMVGIVLSMLLPRLKPGSSRKSPAPSRSWLIYPAMVAIGFYGGFIQVGVGFLLMASLYHLLRISLVRVNMHKVFIVAIYTLPALLIFALSGKVDWFSGLILGAGTATGAWWGAHFAIKGGEKMIRALLAVAILVMAARLARLF
jgi:uncharacterized membrane protein YfcA